MDYRNQNRRNRVKRCDKSHTLKFNRDKFTIQKTNFQSIKYFLKTGLSSTFKET